jgi:hypothetical protein
VLSRGCAFSLVGAVATIVWKTVGVLPPKYRSYNDLKRLVLIRGHERGNSEIGLITYGISAASVSASPIAIG